ncbi:MULTISPECIES: Cd(II)/Pb(II)-responsive transcriptional regulator [Tatumella]|uniref:Cd(II)/Pb(II)-responsive transcriptional regulator n=1 Tax=Tatumella punctata TaxID=399969 RepID=A0ABW1VS28_9GAMM|nr:MULTISPECIES: Cd(II)/Pb(II)-responsive transcriptional regulator [unclassified Tatumella]MBS0857111.1 Cd(II)/Pb(II)-responsive transcriptional regulator [Tatumella sp. JGM16]MBS0878479.1 Cd(II)/Pb(II)-responsive transcriptional regulator [Tatumella sp. JGM82]MBS0891988.1 Cd(II)/Pb(II)-responsive transcriptional regulator [Tatumella sp. JGM94]MBS0894714.1 Cd(II)/Pb(II)-responsive transcriptional regulator [Tatumella sp. JGM130]MBS0903106.1 Cd(II)/Pb(II)-responsive transcriptional regulator [
MKIGELARQSLCSVGTIRYYEKEGLLPEALRDQNNNYRYYDQQHLDTLLFIRRCRALDMAQDEIKQLLQARAQPEADCTVINQLVNEHLSHVRERIAELSVLENQLSELQASCCDSLPTRDCGILKELEHPQTELPVLTGKHIGSTHGH